MRFTNIGLVIRLVVAAAFLAAGLLLMRGRAAEGGGGSRLGAVLIAIGGALFLSGELYGMLELRPFVGRFFDDQWHIRIDIVDALSTLGLLFCAGGLLVHAKGYLRGASTSR